MRTWSETRSRRWAGCRPWSAARSSNQPSSKRCSSIRWKSRACRSSSTLRHSICAAKKRWACEWSWKISVRRSKKVWTTSKSCSRSVSWRSPAEARRAGRRSVDATRLVVRPGCFAGRASIGSPSPDLLTQRLLSAIAACRRTSSHLRRRPRERDRGGLFLDGRAERIRLQSQYGLELLKLPGVELKPPLVEPADSFGVMLLSQVDQQPPIVSLGQADLQAL